MLNVTYQHFSECGVPQVRGNNITRSAADPQVKEMRSVAQKLQETD